MLGVMWCANVCIKRGRAFACACACARVPCAAAHAMRGRGTHAVSEQDLGGESQGVADTH
jgi:hypothetical protein